MQKSWLFLRFKYVELSQCGIICKIYMIVIYTSPRRNIRWASEGRARSVVHRGDSNSNKAIALDEVGRRCGMG